MCCPALHSHCRMPPSAAHALSSATAAFQALIISTAWWPAEQLSHCLPNSVTEQPCFPFAISTATIRTGSAIRPLTICGSWALAHSWPAGAVGLCRTERLTSLYGTPGMASSVPGSNTRGKGKRKDKGSSPWSTTCHSCKETELASGGITE